MNPRSGDQHRDGPEPTAASVSAAALDPIAPAPIAVGAGTAVVLEGTQREPLPGAARIRAGTAERALEGSGARGAAGLRWWTVLPLPAGEGEEPIELLGPGGERKHLGSLELGEPAAVEPAAAPPGDGPLIAVCMAAHEPPPERLRRQIESIREQTWGRWICLISDDCSSPDRKSVV